MLERLCLAMALTRRGCDEDEAWAAGLLGLTLCPRSMGSSSEMKFLELGIEVKEAERFRLEELLEGEGAIGAMINGSARLPIPMKRPLFRAGERDFLRRETALVDPAVGGLGL